LSLPQASNKDSHKHLKMFLKAVFLKKVTVLVFFMKNVGHTGTGIGADCINKTCVDRPYGRIC
jgi:hypothetical protein